MKFPLNYIEKETADSSPCDGESATIGRKTPDLQFIIGPTGGLTPDHS